jgi:hypothetical protein
MVERSNTRDCKSLAFGLQRFESSSTHKEHRRPEMVAFSFTIQSLCYNFCMTDQIQTNAPVAPSERKAFIGNLLTNAGAIFLLAGVMFFIALLCALYLKLDILTAFVIGSLVVGIAAFATGLSLLSKKVK